MNYVAGNDLLMLIKHGVLVPIMLSPLAHLIIVGGSGTGKSTVILILIRKMTLTNEVLLTICDFKRSHEFDGITDREHFAEYEDCYDKIKQFYEEFLQTPEGGDGIIRILIIDEIAGLLAHISTSKEKRALGDEIRQILSEILMLGRSRHCFLWLSMQRYTATIFPASSGSADNFHVCIGLGRLTVDGRKGLFGGEHFEGEEDILFGQGQGIILIDGQPLRSIVFPRASKNRILRLLQEQTKRGGGEAASPARSD